MVTTTRGVPSGWALSIRLSTQAKWVQNIMPWIGSITNHLRRARWLKIESLPELVGPPARLVSRASLCLLQTQPIVYPAPPSLSGLDPCPYKTSSRRAENQPPGPPPASVWQEATTSLASVFFAFSIRSRTASTWNPPMREYYTGTEFWRLETSSECIHSIPSTR